MSTFRFYPAKALIVLRERAISFVLSLLLFSFNISADYHSTPSLAIYYGSLSAALRVMRRQCYCAVPQEKCNDNCIAFARV